MRRGPRAWRSDPRPSGLGPSPSGAVAARLCEVPHVPSLPASAASLPRPHAFPRPPPLLVSLFFCFFLQFALSIAIVVVIRTDLWWYTGWWWGSVWSVGNDSTCYMATDAVSANMCAYGYAVGGIGIFLTVMSIFMQFSKMRVGTGFVYVIDLATTAFGFVWFLPFAVSANVYGHRATEARLPFKTQRHAVWAMGYVCMSLFLVQTGIALKNLIDSHNYQHPPAVAEGVPPTGYGAPGAAPAPPPPPMGYAVGEDYAYGNPVYGAPVYGQGPPPPVAPTKPVSNVV